MAHYSHFYDSSLQQIGTIAVDPKKLYENRQNRGEIVTNIKVNMRKTFVFTFH